MKGLLKEIDAMLCNAQQLVNGWHDTTPVNEWSEWDEQTRQKMMAVHKKVYDQIKCNCSERAIGPGIQLHLADCPSGLGGKPTLQ